VASLAAPRLEAFLGGHLIHGARSKFRRKVNQAALPRTTSDAEQKVSNSQTRQHSNNSFLRLRMWLG
jgi:hypothetical protein